MGRVRSRSTAAAPSQSEREDRIHRALAKKAETNSIPWTTLALEFGVPASTLNDRYNGRRNHREAHVGQQKLPPIVEKALKRWCQDMDDNGFPPRLDLLRGMVTALAQKQAKEEGLPTTDESTYIGKKWISRFLDRNPDLAAKFSNQLDNRRQNASNLITLQATLISLRDSYVS
ncbi:uncharacterized protein LAJ45_03559 [Morchella importuna]|uniref:uncharacterized protein n=1 Tax=Morchella importuna TaxID=1174673 RepID=UPI001E8DA517|nr:uncharacterized protein LAJ45_03559 [Morchella importuna]KAH8152133.1 hypothetical protein LAJ45_03559 [Morchella importuna]